MTNDAGNTVLPLDSDGVQPGFDIVLRGYDRGQVDRQVSWLEEQLGAADRDLQAVTETLRRTEQDATAARRQAEKAAAELARGKPTFEALGERVTAILSLAEEEADVLRQGGREEAEETRQELLAEHAAARDAAQQERRTAQQQSEAILAQAQQEAQRVIGDARRHAAETTSAAQRQVEAMTRQRDAIRAELARVRERFAAVMSGTVDLAEAAENAAAGDPTDDSSAMPDQRTEPIQESVSE